jgi:GNAT superfamily N-acetyltransferase
VSGVIVDGVIEIRPVAADDEALGALLRAYFKDLAARYWEDETSWDEFQAELTPDVRFLLARDGGGAALGCCALQRNPKSGLDGFELKRMYVNPAARGSGVAKALLAAADALARELGAPQIYLETGVRQPEAVRFYEREGFIEIALYPPWVGMELSIAYARRVILDEPNMSYTQ